MEIYKLLKAKVKQTVSLPFFLQCLLCTSEETFERKISLVFSADIFSVSQFIPAGSPLSFIEYTQLIFNQIS